MPTSRKLLLFSQLSGPEDLDLLHYERMVASSGFSCIAGIDEAGRGPLAGPVVAAAVVLPKEISLEGVTDSKKMTERARIKAFRELVESDAFIGIGVASHTEVDKTNILRAALQAMKRAVLSLPLKADFLLVDGIHPVPLDIPQKCLKKGDRICRSISAASVIAKVYRDRIMRSYHKRYPQYGFDRNKGYGTREHLEAIKRFGPCPIHRLTFKGVNCR